MLAPSGSANAASGPTAQSLPVGAPLMVDAIFEIAP